jgi:pentapeptide MXKDX repeat protein
VCTKPRSSDAGGTKEAPVLDACLALLSISALGLAVGLASAPAAAQDKMGKDGTSNGMAKDAMSKDGMKKTDAISKDGVKK